MATHPDTGGQWVQDPSGIFEWKSNGEPGGTEARPLIAMGTEAANAAYAVAISEFDGESEQQAESYWEVFQPATTTTKMLAGDGKVVEVPIASLPPAQQQQYIDEDRQRAAEAAAARAIIDAGGEAYRQAPPPAPIPPATPAGSSTPSADGGFATFVPGGVITRTDPWSAPPIVTAAPAPVLPPFIPSPLITRIDPPAPTIPAMIPFESAPPISEILRTVFAHPVPRGLPFAPPVNVDPIPLQLPTISLAPATPTASGADPAAVPGAIPPASTSVGSGNTPAALAGALTPSSNHILLIAGAIVAALIGAAVWRGRAR